MDSYTRVTHGQIELGPVEFEDEQNDDLDSVEKMDDLNAPIVCGEGSQVLGDFDSAKGTTGNPTFAVERDSMQV